MADLTSIASFWSEQGENWAGGSPINTAIQACLAMHPVAKEAETAIATINSSGYESIGSACLSVQESEIKKANEALPKFQTFCQAIHLEISILVDAPFGTAMGSLTESLFGIRPEEFTVNRGGILGAFGATFNIYDLVKKVIKDDALKLDFEKKMKDLKEPVNEDFFEAMLTALSLDMEGITSIDQLSDDQKRRFIMYYAAVKLQDNPGNLFKDYSWKNAMIDAVNYANRNVGPGIYVNGQGRDPYKDYSYGNFGNFSANGCMAISIYNASISLGEYKSLTDIEQYIRDNHGTLLGGKMGGKPWKVKGFFEKAGYDVQDHGLMPDAHKLEENIKGANGPTVVLYRWRDGFKVGAHYVMVEYDKKENEYLIYNAYNSSETAERVQNLDSISKDGNKLYSAYTIGAK